ncbi:helix-turn-helix domain-containing protein [uncultured Kordia sp.]|uniref:helix-turn-helix domain-containing protein n=1 Tax=uncultured Kordia sp. TaxID=507699 RepID=UPI00260F6B56|nr:helix-turn-helix domain-containing protein [uncultured Kordia sp.]
MKTTYILFAIIYLCIPTNMYATAIQIDKTQQLVNNLLEKQQEFEIHVYVLAAIIVVLILVFGLLCFLNKKGEIRLQKIMRLLESQQVTSKETSDTNDHQLDIDPAIVATILQELKQFEKERGFLLSKITLHEFAKELQTNTKYLSKIINTHKLKSFRNYINDLRIQYSIEKLKGSSNFKKYTVKAMAKEAGFASANSFSKAFQKKTGETVSSFLKQQTDSKLV